MPLTNDELSETLALLISAGRNEILEELLSIVICSKNEAVLQGLPLQKC